MTKRSKVRTVQEAAKAWIDLRFEKMRIEAIQDELKKILEPHLASCEEHSAVFNGWKFTLTLTSRETFRLKEAKENIDGRVLAPYITKSAFTQIRATCKELEKEIVSGPSEA